MKTKILIGMLAAVCGTGLAQEVTYDDSSSPGATIPQSDPTGVSFSTTVSSGDIPTGYYVTGLTVSLNISGGVNGGLVAYLQSPGGSVELMNQPGTAPFGALGSGLNLVLSDAGSSSIQTALETPGSVFGSGSGSVYQAAGSLSSLNLTPADGTWTLFISDVNGGGSPTLNSFSFNITAVPEPANMALGIFGVFLGVLGGTRWYLRSRKSTV
jgi:subtilisin-like proprotein convertase family protein